MVVPPIIPLLLAVAPYAGVAAAGAEVGSSIYSAINQPSAPSATASPAPAAGGGGGGPSVDTIKSAITPQALNIESLTGGSVSPDYLSTIAPQLAGVAGQPNAQTAMQQVIQQLLGSGSNTGGQTPATTSFSSAGLPVNLAALASTPGLSDYLQKVNATVT